MPRDIRLALARTDSEGAKKAVSEGQRRPWDIYLIKGLLTVWFCFFAILSLSGFAFLWYGTRCTGRIYEGVTIQGVDVGGLYPQEASALLQERLNRASPYISLYTAESKWTLSSQDLGYRDLDTAIQEAWLLGRAGVFHEDVRTRLELLWRGYEVIPEFHLEPGLALIALRKVAGQTGYPAQRAQLWVAGLQARTDNSEVGRELDTSATGENIERHVREALGSSSWGECSPILSLLGSKPPSENRAFIERVAVRLIFREVIPPLTEIEGAKKRVESILSDPLNLTFDFPEFDSDGKIVLVHRRWNVDQAILASWLTRNSVQSGDGLSVQVGVDRKEIASFLWKIADEIARAPREAHFTYDPESGVLTTLTPGQNGYALDIEAAKAMVAKACLTSQREIPLPVRVIPPRVTSSNLEALLPLELISEGQSSFQGSRPGRLQNIRVATARFHGVTVPPHADFSFLDHLGLVTEANGYSQSWIIYGDRTLLGPGGGVCQVSTTCFRAVFWGGYPILERHPHAYRVSWYEPPVGLDAAAFSPSVDMRFRNDADTPILILTEVDEENALLYFRFYGKQPNRQVSMEGPITSNPVEAGESILEQDASLSPGQRQQIEWAHDGIDVTLYRITKVEGREEIREKIFSRYKPWPARYRVGTPKEERPPAEG